ncbi:DEKNAAC101576 [Brettanomyces naardenensis]|uniref:DEKNAAC101576 n=1 Tax=Brettanomyces naardenensis TaxID=13370 RepID=A0A448YIH6_BRENA|nr:DEKNAAC101576 [Brettanomyces naardenensis]
MTTPAHIISPSEPPSKLFYPDTSSATPPPSTFLSTPSTPSTYDSPSSLSSALQQPPMPPQTFDYIFCTDFDKVKGPNISKQFPLNLPLISNQLDNLLDLVMPTNLHKFLNKDHCTLIPLYIDSSSGLLSYSKDTHTFVRCYLYSLSYFQHDDSYRNGTAKAISVVTRLPIVHVFKPLLFFLLQEQFAGHDNDFSLILALWENINLLSISQFVTYFQSLPYDGRFVISRLNQGCPEIPDDLKQLFSVGGSGTLVKAVVPLGPIQFPIQIPLSSLLCSRLAMFGSDLQLDSYLRRFLLDLQDSSINYVDQFNECPLTPYSTIKPLHIFLNAILLRKKIVLYCYDSCYNKVLEFAGSLLCLFNDEATENFPFYPILDLGTLDLLEKKSHYLVGTSNLLFKEKVKWDVYYDMDTKTVTVKSVESSAGAQFFQNSTVQAADKRRSVIGSGIKNLFRRSSMFLDGNSPAREMLRDPTVIPVREYSIKSSETSSISSLSSPESISASMIAMWEPSCFPRINKDKINRFLDSKKNPNFFQFGFQSQKIDYGKSIFANSGKSLKPQVDIVLDKQVRKLISEHHTDLTIYMTLTNYLRNLTSNILPAFYHYLNHLRLATYEGYINDKLEDEDYVKRSRNSTSTFLELRTYIKNQKVVQPFPLNFKYSPEMTFLDDIKQAHHYEQIVGKNSQLVKFALEYSRSLFKKHSKYATQIPGFLFDWQGELVRYDPHYALSILDKLIDGRVTQSWRLNGNFLLQFYKAVNQILKADDGNLARLMADFFVEEQPTVEIVSGSDDSTLDGDSDIMTRCYELGLSRFNKLILIAATYQVAKETREPLVKKDLLLMEFKKVLSSVLNNPFFKTHMVHHLDDFMKLNINDFIDYHM